MGTNLVFISKLLDAAGFQSSAVIIVKLSGYATC